MRPHGVAGANLYGLVNFGPIWRNRVRLVARLGAAITLAATAATFSVGGGAGSAQAQITIPTLLPTVPSTTTVPGSGPSTPPTTANLVGSLLKPPSTTAPPATGGAPATPATAATRSTIPGNAGAEGEDVPVGAGPFPADLAAKMNSVRRSRPNSSDQLVDALRPLTDLGVPPEEAMRVGMGRFPIAGRAHFVDDWWFPRFGPGWRLHEGTDLFAERNTPLRSPATGTVRFSDGGLGGISVYVTQADGTYFYLAHLERRAEGLRPGQQVATGDIVGYVGSSGNAAGGATHLHFEVHPAIRIVTVGKGRKAVTKAVSAPVRPGTVLPATDPKPLLDLWLKEALAQLPAVVASYQANRPVPAPPAPAGPAVPASVVLASHLQSGGLIAANAPLARTPLLGLAFLLMVMVVVLMPVLAPHRRLSPVPAIGRHAAEKHDRRRRRPGAGARPPETEANGATGTKDGPATKGRRLRAATRAPKAERPNRTRAGRAAAMPPLPPPAPRPTGTLPFRCRPAGADGTATNGTATNGTATNGTAANGTAGSSAGGGKTRGRRERAAGETHVPAPLVTTAPADTPA